MTTNVKKAIAQVLFQVAASFIEHEVRTALKDKGIDPDEFEKRLREILEAAQKGRIGNPALKSSISVDSALRELGLPANATAAEIRKSFHKLAMENHPDHSKDPATAAKFGRVIEAFNFLKEAGRAK